MDEVDKIKLNEKVLTIDEFEQEKLRLQEKHIKLVEVNKNEYKTRLED